MLKAEIKVTLRKSILDPQGTALKSALNSMDYNSVEDVRIGKYLEVKLNTEDRAEAEKQVKEMCDKLLSNPVIEDYSFELLEV
ncbi:phosphoribosylformylglycinamidine synthase [Desulfitispora alkaliphila]|uniref:phosphoribosylformylglycinamidine synthase subunit PurS n=1 Tax=Desulfitispora alkaliphila TaxID=622674 RepID=UPI003D1DE6CC